MSGTLASWFTGLGFWARIVQLLKALEFHISLPLGSTVVRFWGYLIRILDRNPKKELLWSLWVGLRSHSQASLDAQTLA